MPQYPEYEIDIVTDIRLVEIKSLIAQPDSDPLVAVRRKLNVMIDSLGVEGRHDVIAVSSHDAEIWSSIVGNIGRAEEPDEGELKLIQSPYGGFQIIPRRS